MSIRWWTDKEIVVHTPWGILLNHQKEGNLLFLSEIEPVDLLASVIKVCNPFLLFLYVYSHFFQGSSLGNMADSVTLHSKCRLSGYWHIFHQGGQGQAALLAFSGPECHHPEEKTAIKTQREKSTFQECWELKVTDQVTDEISANFYAFFKIEERL